MARRARRSERDFLSLRAPDRLLRRINGGLMCFPGSGSQSEGHHPCALLFSSIAGIAAVSSRLSPADCWLPVSRLPRPPSRPEAAGAAEGEAAEGEAAEPGPALAAARAGELGVELAAQEPAAEARAAALGCTG
jgi:hypothetical protein